MRKEAKTILKEIQRRAKANRTYYVILERYWPYGSFSDPARIASGMGCNEEIWTEVYKLEKRYRKFCHYIKEVKPQWKLKEVVHYADNSSEAVEINKDGKERRIMLKAPSGDACY